MSTTIIELTGVHRDGTKPSGTVAQKVPFRQDIEIPRGQDLEIQVTVVGQNGTAINLTGQSLKLGLRRRPEDAALAIPIQTSVDLDQANGKHKIVITSSETQALVEGAVYRYGIQLVDAAGLRSQIVPPSLATIKRTIAKPGE